MVARLVASSVDDVSCSAAWLRQVLMMLGGPSRTRARVLWIWPLPGGVGVAPLCGSCQNFYGDIGKLAAEFLSLSSVDATEKNTK